MGKRRFSEDGMVKILREADTSSVADVAKKHGVTGSLTPGRGQRIRRVHGDARTQGVGQRAGMHTFHGV